MFKTELSYFIENQAVLVAQYGGKVLTLIGREVVGVYESVLEAYLKEQERHPLGTFMIQRCIAGPDAYTVTLTSTRLIMEAPHE